MEHLISVEGIECHARHGCLPEESVIGGRYRVDVYVTADVSPSFQSDKLTDTVDYCMINDIVKQEMAIRSNLIEHVASRILEKLKEQVRDCKKISVRVTKFNPPVKGSVERTAFLISWPQ